MKRILTILILLSVSRYVAKEAASSVRENRMTEAVAMQQARDARLGRRSWTRVNPHFNERLRAAERGASRTRVVTGRSAGDQDPSTVAAEGDLRTVDELRGRSEPEWKSPWR